MVDTDGSVKVASQTGREESRKVDQIIHAMGLYNIKVGALQGTKWFGSNVYHMAGAVVLSSGRNLDEPMQRGEGVALVLCVVILFLVGRLQGNNGDHEVVVWCQLVLR